MFRYWQCGSVGKTTSLLNFGPQHPAAHGVLRLVVQLENEYVLSVDPHIGYLHRGSETLCIMKSPYQLLPYVERLDYTSVLTQTQCLHLVFEQLQAYTTTFILQLNRTVGAEFARLLNHYLAITTASLDLSVMAPLF